jgi:predicted phage terminase large subunit-like protein
LECFATQLAQEIKKTDPNNLSELEKNVGTFREFVPTANNSFDWHPHNYTLAEVAQKIADGELTRVMIWVPPGTGKSETISRLLPAYYLRRYPARTVGLVSYGADLAEGLSGDARDYYEESGGLTDDSTKAKSFWRTPEGGGMWSAGFAGAIRGKRFHLGIIDDPHKGAEDLESDAKKDTFRRWWARTWLNRQNRFFKKQAAIVVVMQRLDDEDLCGWLLTHKNAKQWTILALDAVKQDEPFNVPVGVTLYPDKRKVGENLCPLILTPEYLLEQQLDEDAYWAQFLQRPRKQSGVVIDTSKFIVISPEQAAPPMFKAMGVDLALKTKQTNDYTVAQPGYVGVNRAYYLERNSRRRCEAPEGVTMIAQRAKSARVHGVGVEAVGFQASTPQHLKKVPGMQGIAIIELPTVADKVVGARTWTPFLNQDMIYLIDDGSGWVDDFIDECKKFPRGKHDDQVDAVTKFFQTLQLLAPEVLPSAPVAGGRGVERPDFRNG